MPNIYLIGMMGAGKSVTGKKLAELLQKENKAWRYGDLDQRIVDKQKRPITAIFETEGEDFFRNLESSELDEVSKMDFFVASSGGGIILRPQNREQMRQTGIVIYLRASTDVLWERVKSNRERPLLKTPEPKKMLEQIYKKRKSLYEGIPPHLIVDTDQKTADQVAGEIMQWLKKEKII